MSADGKTSDAQAIIDVAKQAAVPALLTPDSPQGFIVPAGSSVVMPDLSAWRGTPTRKTGTVKHATVASLVAYAKAQNDDGATTVWVHPDSGRVVVVLDDHTDGPRWGQHRAVLTLQHTPEWDYWAKADGAWLDQTAFAEHIEGGLMDILRPDSADLLELAQHFHATKDAAFRSSRRLDNGETQFTYDETLDAKAGKSGQVEIPKSLTLLVAPFLDEQARQVPARFQYRLQGSTLKLRYVLERPHLVIRAALDKVRDTLAAEFPCTYVGEPR